ncbi:MAG: hypothetical protein HC840_23330 [Leptolyngbyaceae cyanobacterium RM2_2_4]|nr:hypothetical protein [Leptolyngbyaceae cyanobacterium SM1_4_3]NJO51853.1 hypothetical protein [Leptolyngbyaceae cyanobacterium RM2_2_4]
MQSLFSIGCTAAFSSPAATAEPADATLHREPLRVLVIGSRSGVTNTIQTLYRLGFAEVGEWSPLLPAPNPGEVMSILTRYILANS